MLGVLLFTPLFIWLWPGERDAFARRAQRMAPPLLLTALFLLLGHFGVARLQTQQLAADNNSRIDTAFDLAVPPLGRAVDALGSVQHLMTISGNLNESDFNAFTARLAVHDHALAVQWVPRVRAAEADQFAVAYSEPRASDTALLAFEHNKLPERAAAMARARDSAAPAAASSDALLRSGRAGQIVFLAVYGKGFDAEYASESARRAALRGYVVGLFDRERLFATLAQVAQAQGLTFRVSDITDPATPKPLMGSLHGKNRAASRNVAFADQIWRVEIEADARPYEASLPALSYMVVSVLLALLASLSLVRDANRTEQLESSYQKLQSETQERELLLDEVAQSSDRFRMLTALSSDWFWEQDADLRFVQLSDGISGTGGIPREVHVGRLRWELPHTTIIGGDWAPHQATLAARLPFRNLALRRELPGDTRYVLVSGAPRFAADGSFLGYRGVGSDVTEAKQAELALIAARDAADAANRAKSEFLANMSHEIRTPMNGVIGMLDVLSSDGMSAEQDDAVRTIRSSAFRLLRLIDDILDFSKVEAGRLELERVSLDPAAAVEDLCHSLVGMAHSKNVLLGLFVDPQLPPAVWSDPTRLSQIMNNLIGNAIKFSGGRADCLGRVAVRAELVSAAPLRVAFSVADNGIGMSEPALAKLFTSFSQAETSTTRRFGGSGLGLVIARRLIELMRGTIAVQSTPGVGTRFTVEFPFEAVQAAAPLVLPDLSGLDCIVLDGADAASVDLCAYLRHAGANTTVVSDVDEAVRRAGTSASVVVLRQTGGEGRGPDPMYGRFTPPTRQLLLSQGLRRSSRTLGCYGAAIDINAMRRTTFIDAVMMAAGRLAAPLGGPSSAFAPPASETLRAPGVGEARERRRLILIAEDDLVNQKVLLRQLARLGLAAEVADDGAAALRLWRDGKHALLLTDMHMPNMDGHELARSIRSEEQARGTSVRLPILMLTANALSGEASLAMAAGMDEYLTKPIQMQVLKAALDRWMPA